MGCFVSRGASFRDGWRFKVSPYERFVRLLMQVAARRLAKEIMSKFINSVHDLVPILLEVRLSGQTWFHAKGCVKATARPQLHSNAGWTKVVFGVKCIINSSHIYQESQIKDEVPAPTPSVSVSTSTSTSCPAPAYPATPKQPPPLQPSKQKYSSDAPCPSCGRL